MLLWKCYIQYTSKFGKLCSGHRTGKGQFSFQSQRSAMPNYHTIPFISHTGKVMLKINQARLQQYVNSEFPDVQTGFRKGRGFQRSNCQYLQDHWKNKSSRKTYISALLTMPKPLTVWITINCGKFWKRWE